MRERKRDGMNPMEKIPDGRRNPEGVNMYVYGKKRARSRRIRAERGGRKKKGEPLVASST